MATSKVHALKRILVNFILSMDCKNAVFKRKRQFYRCSYKEWPFERGSVRNSYGILLHAKGFAFNAEPIIKLNRVMYNLYVVAPIPDNRKGVFLVLGISFLISVMAGVVANYISKWLDGNNGDN